MKTLREALSKSAIKNLKKRDKYYIVWSRFLYNEYKPYEIVCSKRDKFYPTLYILPEELIDKFKSKYNDAEFIIYRVKSSFGNMQKFKDEFEKGNIYIEWDNHEDVTGLDIVYDNTEKEVW